MQEFSGKIASINGDKNKLYVLVKIAKQLNLKIFEQKDAGFVFKSQIDNVGETNPEFTRTFQVTNTMTRDCLIQDSNMITRIYDGDHNSIPSLQDFTGYLTASADPSRFLATSGIKVCP